MNVLGLATLLACIICICAKLFTTIRARGLEKILEIERGSNQIARNELALIQNRIKQMAAEKKQQEARIKTTQRNIAHAEKTHKSLLVKKQQEDTVRAYQAEMLKKGRK